MMDGVLGVAALSLAVESERLVSTVEFKINFFKPIQPGDVLLGYGKVIFEGKRLMGSEGTIFRANHHDEVVAKGLGTFNAYPADKNHLFSNT